MLLSKKQDKLTIAKSQTRYFLLDHAYWITLIANNYWLLQPNLTFLFKCTLQGCVPSNRSIVIRARPPKRRKRTKTGKKRRYSRIQRQRRQRKRKRKQKKKNHQKVKEHQRNRKIIIKRRNKRQKLSRNKPQQNKTKAYKYWDYDISF